MMGEEDSSINPHSELAAFEALGTARGWKRWEHNTTEEVRFEIETSPADVVALELQDDDLGGLYLTLHLYPERELTEKQPEEMAAIVGRWLRDAASAIEDRSGRPSPPDRQDVTHAE